MGGEQRLPLTREESRSPVIASAGPRGVPGSGTGDAKMTFSTPVRSAIPGPIPSTKGQRTVLLGSRQGKPLTVVEGRSTGDFSNTSRELERKERVRKDS